MKVKTEIFNMNYCSWEALRSFCAAHKADIVSADVNGLVTVRYVEEKKNKEQ